MSRPRGETALFDLLDGGAAGSGGIAPVRSNPSASGPAADAPRSAVSGEQPVVLGSARTGSGRSDAAHGGVASGSAARQPLFEFQDDCVRLTLTSVRTAVVVFLAIAVIVGAFELGGSRAHKTGFASGFEAGRASYTADTMSEIQAARLGPVSPDVVAGLLTTRPATVLGAYQQAVGETTSSDAGETAWIPGHTYIVAQGFSAGRDADATQAQPFLASRGVETILVRFDSGASQLITVQGFNRTNPTQRTLADKLLERVHDAGADYFASGGGYRLEGYFATFKGDRW